MNEGRRPRTAKQVQVRAHGGHQPGPRRRGETHPGPDDRHPPSTGSGAAAGQARPTDPIPRETSCSPQPPCVLRDRHNPRPIVELSRRSRSTGLERGCAPGTSGRTQQSWVRTAERERFETAHRNGTQWAVAISSRAPWSSPGQGTKGLVTAKYWTTPLCSHRSIVRKPRDLLESAPVLAQELSEEFEPAYRQCHYSEPISK